MSQTELFFFFTLKTSCWQCTTRLNVCKPVAHFSAALLLFFFPLWFSFCLDLTRMPDHRTEQSNLTVPADWCYAVVAGCPGGVCFCWMCVKDNERVYDGHLDKQPAEKKKTVPSLFGCGRQRHFQSYKCETCHSSLNGTAVCTQWTGHLRYCTLEDSAHLAFFFSIRRHTESGGTPVRLQTTGTALDTGML